MKAKKLKSSFTHLLTLTVLTSIGMSSVSCSNNATENLFFTVKGKDIEVTFCDVAASIYSIKYKDQYVTYHPKDYNTFLTSGYCYGRTLGRITGRIKDGKLKVEGKDYQLEINETGGEGNKNNSIHGGTNGLPSKTFKRYIQETDNVIKVSFNYFSPDQEAGYPGDLDTWVTYTVHKKESQIDVDITATSNQVTPVNITTHPFFRLGNTGDIKDHILEIPADNMASFDFNDKGKTDQVVNGIQSVQDSKVSVGDVHPFDFRNGKKIGQDIEKAKELDTVSGGYDHIWVFNKDQNYINLKNPQTNINLRVTTDADAIIMYANCYPHTSDEMNPSGKDTLYSGISVEPYKFFTKDTVSDLNIDKDKPFKRNITYSFTNN